MIEENIDEDVLYIIHQLIEEIDEEKQCDDCFIINSSVKRQIRSSRGETTTTDSNVDLYLCDNCSQKRHDDAQKVLQDLESLAHEVEQRLQAIENTERELDQWRDAQLQKNRDFWDEYRRQVENFSSCRIRTLQYEYTIRQLKTQKIMKRLKRAKYIAEHIDQLNHMFDSSLIELLSSEKMKNELYLLFSTNDENLTTTIDQRKELLEKLEQLSCLDTIIIPGDDCQIDDEIKDASDE